MASRDFGDGPLQSEATGPRLELRYRRPCSHGRRNERPKYSGLPVPASPRTSPTDPCDARTPIAPCDPPPGRLGAAHRERRSVDSAVRPAGRARTRAAGLAGRRRGTGSRNGGPQRRGSAADRSGPAALGPRHHSPAPRTQLVETTDPSGQRRVRRGRCRVAAAGTLGLRLCRAGDRRPPGETGGGTRGETGRRGTASCLTAGAASRYERRERDAAMGRIACGRRRVASARFQQAGFSEVDRCR